MKLELLTHTMLNFSRWTRKSYAIFRSIGKTIKIGFLSFDFHKDIFLVFFAAFHNFVEGIDINKLLDFTVQFINKQNDIVKFNINNNMNGRLVFL